MKPITVFAFVCAVLLCIGFMAPQQDWSAVKIVSTKVAGNVYMLEGRGGNIAVCAGEDGMLMVDDQFAPLADKIKGALKSIGDGELKYVINTHYHGDHTGGNEVFGESATLMAHDNVRKRLMTPRETSRGTQPPRPEAAWPVLTFSASTTLHMNGEEILAMHLPNGHTDGDAVVFFRNANVLHMGDDFFAGRFPYVDLDAGGSVQGLIANIERVLNRASDDIKIIPGHGPVSSKADLQRYFDMLNETFAAVNEHKAAGKSLDEIKAAGLGEKWSSWGSGFINEGRWIETLYNTREPDA